MPNLKRNKWLEPESSDNDSEAGYDSEALERSRGRAVESSRSKRRKTQKNIQSDEEISENDLNSEKEGPKTNTFQNATQETNGNVRRSQSQLTEVKDSNPDKDIPKEDNDMPDAPVDTEILTALGLANLNPKLKPALPLTARTTLSHTSLQAHNNASKKSGVIYLSRVPPFMKPHTLRNFLSPHAPSGLGRIFLAPEDPAKRSSRIKAGGNKKKTFTEGWVEFISKRDAKICAEMLNANCIGGKKGGWYSDDLWNMKYLHGFKWRDLMEQIANEDAERANRLTAEIARSTRENKLFLEGVEKAKIMRTEEEKARKRDEKKREQIEKSNGDAGVSEEINAPRSDRKVFRSHFRQNEVRNKHARSVEDQPDEIRRVVSKIF
jgi:ESF2/ABP1 family protein